MNKKIIVVVGPTGIGKTKLSVEIAKKLNIDIINADSVSVYKDLNIGSAKPTIDEQQNVKHHLLDFLELNADYSVANFQKSARDIIDHNSNDAIIICGGTGLYIQSVLFDYDFKASKRDDALLEQFNNLSNQELYDYLLSINNDFDKDKLHMNNRKRVLRLIQMTLENKLSSNNKAKSMYEHFIIYLNLDNRDELYTRINKRVDNMIDAGLLNEVT
ncbi:MAG: tRNA (adenosine(37)-N6)-dimethylallyltransferase MiaA, partial [Anaeroplasmataceae bacterium]